MKRLDFYALQEILAQVRRVVPNAIIGGGAVRDIFLGAAPKDIDCFIQVDLADLEDRVNAVAYQLKGQVTPGPASYGDIPSYDIVLPGIAQPLNLVHRDVSPLMDVGDYDFGLNQAAVDGYVIVTTAAFKKDIADNTVTYMHADKIKPDWHRKSSANRLLRITVKHPSFAAKNHEILRPWIAEAMREDIREVLAIKAGDLL